MCIRIGVDFKCIHQYRDWILCQDAKSPLTAPGQIRMNCPSTATDHSSSPGRDGNGYGRFNIFTWILVVNFCCSPQCCKDVLDSIYRQINDSKDRRKTLDRHSEERRRITDGLGHVVKKYNRTITYHLQKECLPIHLKNGWMTEAMALAMNIQPRVNVTPRLDKSLLSEPVANDLDLPRNVNTLHARNQANNGVQNQVTPAKVQYKIIEAIHYQIHNRVNSREQISAGRDDEIHIQPGVGCSAGDARPVAGSNAGSPHGGSQAGSAGLGSRPPSSTGDRQRENAEVRQHTAPTTATAGSSSGLVALPRGLTYPGAGPLLNAGTLVNPGAPAPPRAATALGQMRELLPTIARLELLGMADDTQDFVHVYDQRVAVLLELDHEVTAAVAQAQQGGLSQQDREYFSDVYKHVSTTWKNKWEEAEDFKRALIRYGLK